MAPFLKPDPLLVLVVNHDGIHVVGRTEVLSCPVHVQETLMNRMSSIKVCTLPFANEEIGFDWLEIFKHSLNFLCSLFSVIRGNESLVFLLGSDEM